MTVQDMATGETFRSNPCRDIAFFYPKLLEHLDYALFSEHLRNLQDLFRQNLLKSVTEDELKRAYASICLFTQMALDPDLKSPADAMDIAGFSTVPTAAQMLVMDALGRVCAGAFWAGIRSACFPEECPPSIKTLQRRGAELLKAN